MQPALAFIPSPGEGVWEIGPFDVLGTSVTLPLRAYAFAIILGVIVAVWIGERRWAARGGERGVIVDIATWSVPFGLVGGRLYHVATDWQRYFGANADHEPIESLYIWAGGLGIWGAVALGAVGAWIACRRRGIGLPGVADAVAPGIALAQAIGRWGNWFNQELFGGPTTVPWALEIDQENRPVETAEIATYHPTFLYESLWCLGVALLVVWAGRRFGLERGRTFAFYVAAYTVGRAWIELLRVDPAHEFFGVRLNAWTSVAVFLGAVAYLWVTRDRPGEASEAAVESPDGDGAYDGVDGVTDADETSTRDRPADEGADERAEDSKGATQ